MWARAQISLSIIYKHEIIRHFAQILFLHKLWYIILLNHPYYSVLLSRFFLLLSKNPSVVNSFLVSKKDNAEENEDRWWVRCTNASYANSHITFWQSRCETRWINTNSTKQWHETSVLLKSGSAKRKIIDMEKQHPWLKRMT